MQISLRTTEERVKLLVDIALKTRELLPKLNTKESPEIIELHEMIELFIEEVKKFGKRKKKK